MKVENNNFFCALPWVHTHVDTTGCRRLCCHDSLGEKFPNVKLQDFWNGDYLKSIRKKMLAGELVEECAGCTANITKESLSPREVANEIHSQNIENLVSQTKIDGSVMLKPSSFDYRFGNACNLACIICGPGVSSRIENEYKLIGMEFNTLPPIDLKSLENEIFQSLDADELKTLYWAGGEPLASQEHWNIVNYIINHQHRINILDVTYNTNLMVSTKKIQVLNEFLSKIPRYKIFLSLDGIGKVGEFLRTGLVWQTWTENIKGLEKNKIIIDVTVTIPSLLHLCSLVRYTVSNKLFVNVRSIALVDAGVILHPSFLPKKILKKVVKKIKSEIFLEHGINEFTIEYFNFLNRIFNSESVDSKYGLLGKILKDSGVDKLNKFEDLRKKSDPGRLTYEEVLGCDADILNWWHKKSNIKVLLSDLCDIRGRWNYSQSVEISFATIKNYETLFSKYVKVLAVRTKVTDGYMKHTLIMNSQFTDSVFSNCSIDSCTLRNVVFRNCHFENCIFDSLDLSDIIIENKIFSNLRLKKEDLL